MELAARCRAVSDKWVYESPHHQRAESRMLNVRLRLRLRRRSNITDASAKIASVPTAHRIASDEDRPSKMVSSPAQAAAIDANNMPLQFLALRQQLFDASLLRMIVARGVIPRAICSLRIRRAWVDLDSVCHTGNAGCHALEYNFPKALRCA